jgi:hypothetical protein
MYKAVFYQVAALQSSHRRSSISIMSYVPRLHNEDGEVNILLISTIIFGLVAFAFSVTSIFAVLSAQDATAKLKSAQAAAVKVGAAEQKEQDIHDAQVAAEAPFRSYRAPNEFGNFEIKFPKNWNAYVTEELAATNQVVLTLHPEFVRVQGGGSAVNNFAFRALLVRQNKPVAAQSFESRVKSGKMTSKPVTVAGIASTQYTGAYDEKHTGIVTLIPVRDKTVEFITDSTKDYLTEFNQIVAQAIIPT